MLWVASQLEGRGGIGRVVAGGALSLAARGLEVHVAGPRADGDLAPFGDLPLHVLPRRGAKLAALVDLLPLAPDAAKKVRAYFTHLREVSTKLREIAEQERRGEALTSAQLDFMNHMVSIDGRHGGLPNLQGIVA